MALIQFSALDASGAYLPYPLPSGYLREDRNEVDFALVETHNGCVISERERNMYDDSDFFCTIWDDETNSFQEIMFATTRSWSYPCLATSIDASPEIQEKWAQYCKIAEAYAQYLYSEYEAKLPKVGRMIEVIKGRKLKHGSKWWIVSVEQSKYNRFANRLGLRSEDGERAWTDETNVRVIG